MQEKAEATGSARARMGRCSLVMRLDIKKLGWVIFCYALVLALWELLNKWLGPIIIPSLLQTAQGMWEIFSRPALSVNIAYTFYRTVLGVVVSACLGLIVVLTARYLVPLRFFFLNVFYPGIRAIPLLSIALLAIVWFQLGTGSVVFIVMVAALPIYLVGLWEGLKVVDASLVEMANVITVRRLLIFRKVVFPMLIPTIFAATKLAFSVSFKLALFAELLAASDGMGFQLSLAQQEYKTNVVFAWSVIVIALVIFFDYYFFNVMERKYLYKWESER